MNKINSAAGKIISAAGKLLLGLCLGITLSGCKKDVKFPDIGEAIASPADMDISSDGQTFYTLNADAFREYDTGSIVMLSPEGEKKGVITTPRLGRVLTVAKNTMVVVYARDRSDDAVHKDKGIIEIYDVSDATKPSLKKTFLIDDDPFNATLAIKDGAVYPYFAVTAVGGYLYIGKLDGDLSQSTLKKVRDYRSTRRAIYIDPVRQLVLGFPTTQNPVARSHKDTYFTDAKTLTTPNRPNEIPDFLEAPVIDDAIKNNRTHYQFFIYDLADGIANDFPYAVVYDDEKPDSAVDAEMRWSYFNLRALDNTFDPPLSTEDDQLMYRSNFWEAKADPDNAQVFYISQRGILTEFSNNIVKVSFQKDPKAVNWEGKSEDECRATGGNLVGIYCVPRTDRIMNFERVYGFSGDETAGKSYPGDFVVTSIQGQKMLVVNHFKGIGNFSRKDQGYRIVAKTIGNADDPLTVSTLDSDEYERSYYNIAVNSNGRAMTGLFFGNAVQVMDIVPGDPIDLPTLPNGNPVR